MSRLTDLIAEAKAKDAQMGVDLERELRTLSARLPLDLNCRKLQFRISVQPAEAKA